MKLRDNIDEKVMRYFRLNEVIGTIQNGYDLNDSEFDIILYLGGKGLNIKSEGICVGKLAKEIGRVQSTTSTHLTNLMNKGIVDKERFNPENQRERKIRLEKKGQGLYVDLRKHLDSFL